MENGLPPAERLSKLGLSTPLEKVLQVVARLDSGEALYQLYAYPSKKSRGEWKPILAKKTAQKIKKFYKDGKLAFLKDEPYDAALRSAEPLAEALVESSSPPRQLQLSAFPFLDYVEGKRARDKAIVDSLPQHDWSFRGLTKVGFPDGYALAILSLYDELDAEIRPGLSNFSQEGGLIQPLPTERDVGSYVLLHHHVQFRKEYPDAPYWATGQAAMWVRDGLLANNDWLIQLGRNVLRYAIWKGEANVYHFRKSLEPLRHRVLQEIERTLEHAKQYQGKLEAAANPTQPDYEEVRRDLIFLFHEKTKKATRLLALYKQSQKSIRTIEQEENDGKARSR